MGDFYGGNIMAKYNTSYYDKANKEYAKAQDKIATQQKKDATTEANSQLKEAYVTRMQNQRKLNDNLMSAGIRGGTTETANLSLMNNYEKSRGTIQANRQKAIQTINTNTEQNKLAYKQQSDAAKQSYIEQRQAEARANAREDKLRKAKETKSARTKYWTSLYGGYYKVSSLQKALKKAKSPEHKAIIRARISYLRKHKKGY